MPNMQIALKKWKEEEERLKLEEERILQELRDWNNCDLNKGAKRSRNWKQWKERLKVHIIRNC